MNRNIVSRVLGHALLTLRQPTYPKIDELAARLGLSKYSLHRIEAGQDPLHPKYVMKFAREFAKRGVQVSRLSLVVAAVHAIEASRAERTIPRVKAPEQKKTRRETYDSASTRLIVDELTVGAPDLRSALQQLVDAPEPAELKNLIRAASERLIVFMSGASDDATRDGTTRPLSWLGPLVERVNPIYFDIVADQMSRLAAFEPIVKPDGLAQWERANSRRFRKVFGITAAPDTVADSANSNFFNWDYLWRPDFQGVFLLVDVATSEATKAAEALRASLERSLLQSAVRRQSDQVTSKYKSSVDDKLHVMPFNTLTDEAQKALRALQERANRGFPHRVEEGRSRRSRLPTIQNAWFYMLDLPGYALASVDCNTTFIPNGTAHILPWRDTLEFTDALEAAWAGSAAPSLELTPDK